MGIEGYPTNAIFPLRNKAFLRDHGDYLDR